jgi:hypothetical protein
MAGNSNIPSVIHDFNVYKTGNVLVGLTGEVTLPDFEAMTDTISGAGLLGEIEETIIGQFGSMKLEIPFRMLCDDIFKFMDPTEIADLNLRAARQEIKKQTGEIDYKGMRIAVRGKLASFKPGTVKQAGQMGASISLELLYILIEFDGETKLELDKLNSVFKANGKDLMEKVRGYC